MLGRSLRLLTDLLALRLAGDHLELLDDLGGNPYAFLKNALHNQVVVVAFDPLLLGAFDEVFYRYG